ncbi:hypothetical protein CYMTET_21007 [Cymbomonas tetramitiformis]|uniref:EamA domain-containing protein n=1 Tax=Cymbomonas tetramitiformis TaxID=36881 RepID=A0AAE0L3K6_9CHLO|nr:hypothetical protein CYMTET_21007 [Cymbomonas tetramitiformis]
MAVFEIILTRSITVTSFLLLVARVQGTSLLGQRENRAYLIAYAFLRILAITLCFFAIGFMPLYAFTIVVFTYPSIACICTHVILGEPFGPFDICSSICSLLGVVLISEPSALGFHPKGSLADNDLSNSAWNFGIFLGLCGAVTLAFATVTLRKLGGKEPTNVVIFYQNGMGLIVAPIGVAIQGGTIPGMDSTPKSACLHSTSSLSR